MSKEKDKADILSKILKDGISLKYWPEIAKEKSGRYKDLFYIKYRSQDGKERQSTHVKVKKDLIDVLFSAIEQMDLKEIGGPKKMKVRIEINKKFEEFIKREKTVQNWTESTLRNKTNLFERKIRKFYEGRYIDEINEQMVIDFKEMLSENSNNKGVTKNLFMILNCAFLKWVYKEGLVNKDYSDIVKRFKNERPMKEGFWDHKTFYKCMKYVKSEDLRLLYDIMFSTGCRMGEAMALRFSDVDFKEKNITINRQWNQTAKNYSLPKQNSIRKIEVDDNILEKIKKHMEKSSYLIEAYGKETLIVSSKVGKNKHVTQTPLDRNFKKAIKEANISPRITLHGLRDSYITNALNNGASLKAVSEQVGHKDTSVTLNIYYKTTPEDKRNVAKIYGELKGERE